MTQSKIRPRDQTATMGTKAKFRHPGWAKLKCQLCARSGHDRLSNFRTSGVLTQFYPLAGLQHPLL